MTDDIETLRKGPVGPGRRRVDYESELNSDQLDVVRAPGGPMLVLAGAGTGKTRTLVFRVCRLIEDGVPPGDILLLTFTNKAAREMLDRVESLIERDAGLVMGGTFHSVGHRILRRYADRIGYSSRFSILDREDASDLMGAALADIAPESPSRRLPRSSLLLSLYSLVINTGRELEDVLTERAPQYLAELDLIVGVFRRYLERKRNAQLMDFDDLLVNWLLLLRRDVDVRRRLATRFRHILVDEYQDTNRLQADIVEGLLGPDRNLMVVGDDAQSIFGFRGAEFANILQFPDRHPDCTVFRLETNYRSTRPILDLTNASIANNERQHPKNLVTSRPGEERPVRVNVATPELQASWVAEQILQLRDEGIDLDKISVLYRAHNHSLELQVELTRRNIPYSVRSGVRFFEQRHVKDLLSHLRIIENPHDEIAFSRAMKLRQGIGERTAASVWAAVGGGDGIEHRVAAVDADALSLSRRARKPLRAFSELLRALAGTELRRQPGEAVRAVVERFYGEYARSSFDNAHARLDDLEQLALFADGYDDVASFLAEVTLLNELSGEDIVSGPPDEQVTLSSVHQAKGLEWSAVFVLWLAEGRFPSARAEDLEEERRLFYVAATRARDLLYLLCPQLARDRYRVDVVLDASRFLQELPEGLVEVLTVAAEPDADVLAEGALEGRYTTPSFLTDGGDDEPVH